MTTQGYIVLIMIIVFILYFILVEVHHRSKIKRIKFFRPKTEKNIFDSWGVPSDVQARIRATREKEEAKKSKREVEFIRHFSQIYTKSNTITTGGAYKRVFRSKALTVGIFHSWGVDHEEYDEGIGNYSTAIVETKDGTIHMPKATEIKFVDNLP